MALSPIPELLDELRAGKMIILVDDEDRENEGDLVLPGQFITPEIVNFMITEARGELCLALAPEKCDQLGLELQAAQTTNRFGTAFTITIEAAEGVTTGISAADRARTIAVASAADAKPTDLVRPGHVHPLRARRGGTLVRPGQTEGSVDLCRLAGLNEAAVIIEILKPDGTMARMPDLEVFAEKHDMKIGAVADLIAHRRATERLVSRGPTVTMPTAHGDFDVTLYTSPFDDHEHIALTRGIEIPTDDRALAPITEPVIGRVHSECLTGDVFGSHRCDCGDQLDAALAAVGKHERGFVLYMRQEGRGIGLANKLRAYRLQDEGMDTVDANRALGFRPDERNYGTGASILHDLGIRRIKLLTNNPTKRKALTGYGLEIAERVPLVMPSKPANEQYLETKRTRMGHMF